jgi:excisionase family DNA binding protein
MLTGTFYDTFEAAEYTGLTDPTIRRLTRAGKLSAVIVGNTYLYERFDLDTLNYKLERYLTQSEIAKRYGISRQAVHKALTKHKIHSAYEGLGIKRNAALYHAETVKIFALSMGWTEPSE